MNRSAHVPAAWKTSLKISTLALTAALALVSAASAADAPDAAKVDFVKDVQPIFKASCVKCHHVDADKPNKKPAGKFRLDDKAAALKGGKSGAAIVAGNAKDSLLFKLLTGPVTMPKAGEDEDKDIPPMPHAKKGDKFKPLTDDQIATIRQWIDQGAAWPDAM
jgi:mono/diheme cytochrome c family protein